MARKSQGNPYHQHSLMIIIIIIIIIIIKHQICIYPLSTNRYHIDA